MIDTVSNQDGVNGLCMLMQQYIAGWLGVWVVRWGGFWERSNFGVIMLTESDVIMGGIV